MTETDKKFRDTCVFLTIMEAAHRIVWKFSDDKFVKKINRKSYFLAKNTLIAIGKIDKSKPEAPVELLIQMSFYSTEAYIILSEPKPPKLHKGGIAMVGEIIKTKT